MTGTDSLLYYFVITWQAVFCQFLSCSSILIGGVQEFTNKLFQLANPLAADQAVSFSSGEDNSPEGKFAGLHSGSDNPGYNRLEPKYVNNLIEKCVSMGGSLCKLGE